MINCVVCSKFFNDQTIENNRNLYPNTCKSCVKILSEEAPGLPLVGDPGVYSDNVTEMLDELNRRMPGLFEGKSCPKDPSDNSFECNCSYLSKCKALSSKK